MSSKKSTITKLSFEDALKRLEEIVEILSLQKVNLDSMIELYEEGEELRQHCSKKLDEAKMKIEIVAKNQS
jgi:exodeoxyribonuclease VII small subunit